MSYKSKVHTESFEIVIVFVQNLNKDTQTITRLALPILFLPKYDLLLKTNTDK